MAAPVSVPTWKLPKWLNALMRAMVRWYKSRRSSVRTSKMADQERALYPAEPPTPPGSNFAQKPPLAEPITCRLSYGR